MYLCSLTRGVWSLGHSRGTAAAAGKQRTSAVQRGIGAHAVGQRSDTHITVDTSSPQPDTLFSCSPSHPTPQQTPSTHRDNTPPNVRKAHLADHVVNAKRTVNIALVSQHEKGHASKGRQGEERVELGGGGREGRRLA